jgi:hypothetical protein
MAKKSFLIHIDSLLVLNEMTDEQAGKLLKAIHAYHTGSQYETDLLTRVAFAPFKAQFDRDLESYEKTCERNKTNGAKGGRPKTEDNPTEPKETQKTHSVNSEPKKPDNDNDKDSEKDKEKDNKKIKSSSGKPDSLSHDFLEVYNKFLESKTGTTEQFSMAGRAGLNKIIGYLRSQVEKKHPGADIEHISTETINAWQWILNHYDSWDNFYKQQLKLEQINSNLLNIINSIKNGTGKKQRGAVSAADAAKHTQNLAAEAIAISRARAGSTGNSPTEEA